MSISDFLVTPFGGAVENAEFHLSNLYLHINDTDPDLNEQMIADNAGAGKYGRTYATRWAIHHGVDSAAELVARAPGLITYASDSWHQGFTINFQNQRFKGSTLQVMGVDYDQDEWAIVGGTGEFAMARGIIKKYPHSTARGRVVVKLNIHGFCSMKPTRLGIPYPRKTQTWGGNVGQTLDVIPQPWRLESFKIHEDNGFISSFALKYVDRTGSMYYLGPYWGDVPGTTKITLSPSETLQQVHGTSDNYRGTTIVTSLTFTISNRAADETFGKSSGTDFSPALAQDECIVGFYGQSYGKFLTSIGFYVHKSSVY
ncbi:uncharacterized protein LOC100842141 [Brachypodium distachyon]|uniref:Dirigent protein n=1 Tax=Brachypodium distachyon TaxID=15368 RepID=I1HWH4_BRADI|nr:uncharacterized protein LOC100842141 [Brachypodium distachyon]KQJ92957.1 hypothetical protein BRADI_3g01837v3 [Brachypodium distachyon]|eukprot:XP_024318224.1 uncharacterized protein LOC100842141 [Brachypodium distachyon]